MPKHYCSEPGCDIVLAGTKKRCPQHRRKRRNELVQARYKGFKSQGFSGATAKALSQKTDPYGTS